MSDQALQSSRHPNRSIWKSNAGFQIFVRVGLFLAVANTGFGIAAFWIERTIYGAIDWNTNEINLYIVLLIILLFENVLSVAFIFVLERTISPFSNLLAKAGFICWVLRNLGTVVSNIISLCAVGPEFGVFVNLPVLRMTDPLIWSSNAVRGALEAMSSVSLSFACVFYYTAFVNGPRHHRWVSIAFLLGVPVGIAGLLTFYSSLEFSILVRTWITMIYRILFSATIAVWFWSVARRKAATPTD
jgi:hypothetical protein